MILEKMPKHMTFHVYIDIVSYRYYGESRMHKVPNRLVQFFLASFYNIASFIFGVWYIPFFGFIWKLKYVGQSISKNFNGGYDYTMLVIEEGHNKVTNLVWRKLNKGYQNTLDRNEIDLLIFLQLEYEKENNAQYNAENIQYLSSKVNRGYQQRISKQNICEFLIALSEVQIDEANIAPQL